VRRPRAPGRSRPCAARFRRGSRKRTSVPDPGGAPRRNRPVLLALGNAASPDALPAVVAKVRDASHRTRAAAVFALRWIDLPEAERQIRAVLATDPDEWVSLHALEALQFRSPNDRIDQALRTAASSDPSERVRAAALAQLSND
jgi:HEAT repeat protein